ncbi:MAG: DUF4349 domain-containing protein, partial [Spirochaetales bacterium]|nr:DUF4349 domain-containing protein [Spirochaetales bacterium]
MKNDQNMRYKLFLLLLAVLSAAGGCSAKQAPAYAGRAQSADIMAESALAEEEAPADLLADPVQAETGRKLVKRANLTIRTDNPAAAEKPILDALEKYSAYVSSTDIRENSRDYTIRVPSASYEAMLADLSGIGRIIYRSENAEDVTLRYYDLEGRLATKKELLATYQSYLGKAKNIEEILSVEARIAELQSDIDRTGKDLRTLGNLVDYATITLEVLGPVTSSSYSAPTIGERILALFRAFGDFASGALVVLVGIVIYGIPVILGAALLFWLLF